jgi:nucleotidyltransferase substrate binding protein (TIGR01987 family)
MANREKLDEALKALQHALIFENKIKQDDFFFGGIAKAFEVAIEYAWKYFRSEAADAGLEVPSPRDAIKQAANLGLIDNLEEWLGLLKTKNIAVHDYIGLPKDEYLAQIKRFATLAGQIRTPKG